MAGTAAGQERRQRRRNERQEMREPAPALYIPLEVGARTGAGHSQPSPRLPTPAPALPLVRAAGGAPPPFVAAAAGARAPPVALAPAARGERGRARELPPDPARRGSGAEPNPPLLQKGSAAVEKHKNLLWSRERDLGLGCRSGNNTLPCFPLFCSLLPTRSFSL